MSGQGRLTPAQTDVLRALAGIAPAWRLAGGAALAGFHTRHRETRDLDLFWPAKELAIPDAELRRRLASAGFSVEVLQRDPAFCRLRVTRGPDALVVDLVADPVPTVASPSEHAVGDVSILVDSPHELLVSKLCALLSRSELRDLEDVRALLHSGGDLERALGDAPRKEAGFSPITLAWVIKQLPVRAMGRVLARPEDDVRALEEFREELARAILAAAKPA
jgi:hypothetical protein